jgi:flagellar motor switch protein FliG
MSTTSPAASTGRSLELRGAQRAAAIMLLIGEEYGAPIWSMLEEEEVRLLTHAMVQLGSIDAETLQEVVVDFVTQLSGNGNLAGSFERTESLLLKIFPPEQVTAIMADINGMTGRRVWQRLAHIDAEILANYLRNEYPQTVAVILSRIKPDQAAKILAILPDEFAIDVVNRMLRMESVQKEALEHIEQTLKTEFVTTIAQTSKRDAHESMAEVFNSFDRQTESRFLTALDDVNRDAAQKIRQLMFTFEDLTKLDAGGVQTLMRSVDRDVLARALKGAPETTRQFFLSNMSTRAAKNLQDEIQALGPVRLKDVDEAQGKMVNLAKELADKGDIMISKNRGEDELVY